MTFGANSAVRGGYVGAVSAAATWSEVDVWQRAQTGELRVVVVPTDARSLGGAPPADEVRSRVLNWFGRPDLVSVAVMHGPIGADQLSIALACDLRMAVDDVRIDLRMAVDDVRIKVGSAIEPGFIDRLVATIGYAAAAPLLLAGQEVTADAAVALGLACRAVSPAAARDVVDAIVSGIVAGDRDVTTEIKSSLLRAARTATPARTLFADDVAARDRTMVGRAT